MSRSNQWVNRTEVRSQTSNRIYVVSQHATKRFWGCSCPSWRTRRRCRHLEQLGLPGGEEPYEVEKTHARKKGFLDGYRTYDPSTGHGSAAEWRRLFAERMNLDEARRELRLPASAGWDDVRRAIHVAGTESLIRLVTDFETAVQEFSDGGSVAERAEAVRAAKFRIEVYAEYLDEQRRKLDAAVERITGELLAQIGTEGGADEP